MQQGKVEAVFITTKRHTLALQVDLLTLELEGIVTDCHYGFKRRTGGYRERDTFGTKPEKWPRRYQSLNWRQWSAVSIEELKLIAKELKIPAKQILKLAACMGANIVVSGIKDFTQIAPGTMLVFSSGCMLFVTAENLPCAAPGELINQVFHKDTLLFPTASMHRRGLVGMVFKPGEIKPGDEVQLFEQKKYILKP